MANTSTIDLFNHHDTLSALNEPLPLGQKLSLIHTTLKQRYQFIDRLAISLYDQLTDTLKTYAHSTDRSDPLSKYETRLTQTPSLLEILKRKKPRVVQDLGVFAQGPGEHTQKISSSGFRASYTMPMYQGGSFMGFLFFNSYRANPFDADTLAQLDLYGHLIASIVTNELSNIRTLIASIRTARGITHQRDFETGGHIERTAHYARLIAKELAEQYQFSDEVIEHIFMFSPLHDIGKIAIPDAILHKPGKLDEAEREIMKTHTTRGREMIDNLLSEFGLESIQHIEMMGNITEYHHEAINGSGYPHGLKGDEIPIEARISAVADVFDALTSKRPYKEAWSNARACDMLRSLAGDQLDSDCVNALLGNERRIVEIQQQFRD